MGGSSIRLSSRQFLYLWTLKNRNPRMILTFEAKDMKRLLVPLALSFCLLLAVSQHAVIAKDSWVGVRTKNFLLVGNAGEKDIRKVGLKLEQFREVFTHLFPQMKFNTPVPTTVVVFKSHDSYAPFKPGPNIAGHF